MFRSAELREASGGAVARGGTGILVVSLAWALALAGCRREEDELVLVGSLERTSIELVAPQSEVIRALPLEPGQRVSKGELVVQLDATLMQAEVAGAEAALASATAALSMAEDEHARAQKLRADSVISKQQLDRARLTLDEARARHREAHVRLQAWLKRLNDLTIGAPVSGLIDQLPFEVGERIPVGAVVAVMLSDELPWVRVWIPEEVLTRVSRDAQAEVSVDGMERLSGHVVEVSHEPEYTPHYALTERERSLLVFQAKVQIDAAPESLRPGMPAEVRIPLRPAGASSRETTP